MRKICFLLICFMSYCNTAFAERSDPMMAWPYLVQIDWNAYHGKMIESCKVKFPEYANSFKDAIGKWNDHNSAAILDIRQQIKDRIKTSKGLSEIEVTKRVNLTSKMVTEQFLQLVAITPENEWKDVCTGKYVTETLPAMDFVQYRPIITAAIPTLRENYILPEN